MSTPVYQEGSWKPSSGSPSKIAYRLWMPSNSRALVVIIHGFGEHGGRYAALAQALAERGFSVAVPDICGHGLSSGARGDVADVPSCVALLRRLTEEQFLPLANHKRYALFGHSFGGLAAIQWAMDAPKEMTQLIVQSPLLKVAFHIPAWKDFLGLSMASVWPTFSLAMNLDVSALSHDAAVVRAYQSDPLVHNQMSARCYSSLTKTRDNILAHPQAISVPTLLLCGQADGIISVATARGWFEQLSCRKKYVEYPESYHELHHESVRQHVIEECVSWVAEP